MIITIRTPHLSTKPQSALCWAWLASYLRSDVYVYLDHNMLSKMPTHKNNRILTGHLLTKIKFIETFFCGWDKENHRPADSQQVELVLEHPGHGLVTQPEV